jgi:hypothetical protein
LTLKHDVVTAGLTGVSLEDLREAFADRWEILSIKEFQAEVTPETHAKHP